MSREKESKYTSIQACRGVTSLASQTFVAMAGIPLVFFIRKVTGCLVESCAVLDTFVLEVALEQL